MLEALGRGLAYLLSGSADVLEIVLLSLRVSGTAVALGVLLGLPVGVAVGLGRFRGRRIAIAAIHTGFALPPVVVGLFIYIVLSRSGPLGGLGLLFTPTAMIIAQAVLAAPYVAGITLAAVQSVPESVRLQARALGASRMRALATHLREARLGIGAAVVAGFGAVISEVGAVMLVGGNVQGETRVMTTAIVLETRRGDIAAAVALGIVLLSIAFAVNIALTRLQQGPASVARSSRPGA
ncbi:MAG TPA: ABC transporter permease [Longimicrobiales bacterium]|jgi:tungstate transport system permease protein|nr:ABC transporter permease [Longimicrobiales bacterium]